MSRQDLAINPVIELEALQFAGTKRAPYALEVEQLLAVGKVPNVYVFAGANGWQRAKEGLNNSPDVGDNSASRQG